MFSLHGAVSRYIHGATPLLSRSLAGIKGGRPFSCRPYLWSFPPSGFAEIRETEKIEEETIPSHTLEDYYPVSLGEVFNSRYRVVSKQGYGVGSTVWLCRDLMENRHLTLKVCVRRAKQQSHELEISDHLNKYDATHRSGHPGKRLVQTVLDSFEIDGPHGRHVCLLYQPLGMKLSEVIARMPNGLMPADILQRTAQLLFIALDYIHRRGIVHTGKVQDDSVFTCIEKDEIERPVARKVLAHRFVYFSRPPAVSSGSPVLCDFGGARVQSSRNRGNVMYDVYRPPEVILDMEWDTKIDIWGLSLMVWRMLEGNHLFSSHKSGALNNEEHLAEMVSLMGPPPLEFLRRSPVSQRYWDEEGNWKGIIPITEKSIEEMERRLSGDEYMMFIRFMRKVLRWLPEERPTAGELVYDDFLMQAVLAFSTSADGHLSVLDL